jgi:hypothetical protein
MIKYIDSGSELTMGYYETESLDDIIKEVYAEEAFN